MQQKYATAQAQGMLLWICRNSNGTISTTIWATQPHLMPTYTKHHWQTPRCFKSVRYCTNLIPAILGVADGRHMTASRSSAGQELLSASSAQQNSLNSYPSPEAEPATGTIHQAERGCHMAKKRDFTRWTKTDTDKIMWHFCPYSPPC